MNPTSNRSTSRWRINPEFAHAEFLKRLDLPKTLVLSPAEQLTVNRPKRRTDVFRIVLPEFPGRPLIIKRYRPDFWFALKEFFRPSRAQRAYQLTGRLHELNIPTAVPVAAVDVRRLGWLKECYFVTLEVPASHRLRAIRAVTQAAVYNRWLIRNFAVLMARLHNAGFQHSDVTLSNFLVTHDAPDRPRLVVIDVDALRPRRHVSLANAIEDLATLKNRVPMSLREQSWFLAQYARARTDPISPRELVFRLGIPLRKS